MVGTGVFVTLIVILVAVCIGLLIGFVILLLKEKERPEDDTIVFNIMSYRTNGHAFGTASGFDRHSNGRWKINMTPKDVKPKDVLNKNWKNHDIYIDSNKLLLCPKGFPSAHKNTAILCPPFPEDIPKEFRDTPFGKLMMIWTEKQNVEKTIVDAIREGSLRKDEFLKELGDGEMSAETFSRLKGLLLEDFKEVVVKAHREKTSSGSPHISRAPGGT